jgi:FlaA1/EpsC-like NDP-sugar epimerase
MKIIPLAKTLLRQNAWFIGAFQAVLIVTSLLLAWLLRFDFTLPDRTLLLAAVPLLVLIRMGCIARFGLLHGWWRYTGWSDALDVVKSVLAGSVIFIVLMRYLFRLVAFPTAVYALEPLLTAAALIGVRTVSRVLAESMRQDLASTAKVLLIGAGIGGQTVAREIRQPGSEYSPVGYVDDDPSKVGLKIEGIPVLGTLEQVPEIAHRHAVDEVLIAVPSATSQQMQRFVAVCERAQVKFRTVPALRDVIARRVSLSDFRAVQLEDLLGRDPVKIDLRAVRASIQGRAVMVTGAAGSIGSELCRQILEFEPRTLICVDQNETGMFFLEKELSPRRGGTAMRWQVADVRDRRRMECIFRGDAQGDTQEDVQGGAPETIFHAAAYKHVPLMEANVREAVQNNVFGLLSLLGVACEHRSATFILISSDKAVNPCSVMGATKRICELIISQRPTHGMRCLAVRFGNVLGSNGSVVPVLQEQLQKNQALTITHPDMTRFFMTIQEAVSLVLQASLIGEQSDTLVLDMGRPVPIVELARTLIQLSGKSEREVPIRFTGLRLGERLTEELFYAAEEVTPTSFTTIKRARGMRRDWPELSCRLDELEATLFSGKAERTLAKIKQIVPEYSRPAQAAACVPAPAVAAVLVPQLVPQNEPDWEPAEDTIPAKSLSSAAAAGD